MVSPTVTDQLLLMGQLQVERVVAAGVDDVCPLLAPVYSRIRASGFRVKRPSRKWKLRPIQFG